MLRDAGRLPANCLFLCMRLSCKAGGSAGQRERGVVRGVDGTRPPREDLLRGAWMGWGGPKKQEWGEGEKDIEIESDGTNP